MNKEFEEDLEKLLAQAFKTGHVTAAWEDGAGSNEWLYESEAALEKAKKEFWEKYHDKITDGTK